MNNVFEMQQTFNKIVFQFNASSKEAERKKYDFQLNKYFLNSFLLFICWKNLLNCRKFNLQSNSAQKLRRENFFISLFAGSVLWNKSLGYVAARH